MTASPSPFSADRLQAASLWRMTFLLVQGGGSVTLAAALGHILGGRQFATTSLVQGVLVIAQAIGDFGLAQATVTVLPAWTARSPDKSIILMAGATWAYGCAAGAALVLTLASASLVPEPAIVPVLVCAPAAAATVLLAGADGLLRAGGEFRRPVLFVATSELGGFAGIPVALLTRSAVWTCVAISAGTTLGAAGAIVTLRGYLRRFRAIRRAGVPRDDAQVYRASRQLLRAAVPLGVAQAFIILGARIDTLLAASMIGLVAAGTFEGAWRVFQLGQYAAGALATAAAPFIATALGADRPSHAIELLRQLLLRLVGVGLVAGALIYVARWPLAHVLAGSLATQVADGLVFLAVISPIAATGVAAFYTLIAIEGERRFVVGCFALGAGVNIGVCLLLAVSVGAHGILLGCASGVACTSALLLGRLLITVRTLGSHRSATPARTGRTT